MGPELTVQANQADCIQQVTHLGTTTYHNICTGAATTLPWGLVDWGVCVVLVLLGGLAVFMGVLLVKVMCEELW